MNDLTKIRIFPTGMRLHEWIAFAEGYFRAQDLDPEVMWDVYHGQMTAWTGGYKARPQDQPFLEGTQAIGNACAWGSVCNAGAGMGKFVPDACGVVRHAISVRPDSPIRRPEDLRGVPVAVGLMAGGHYNVPYRLEKYLPLEDIKIAPVGGFGRRLDALLKGGKIEEAERYMETRRPIFVAQGYPIRKVDVDSNPELARRFNVTRIPALILVVDGVEKQRLQGVVSENELKALCNRVPRRENPDVAGTDPKELDRRTLPPSDKNGSPERQAADSEKQPTPSKPGFKWPFGHKKEDIRSTDIPDGTLSRAKAADQPQIQLKAEGTPLAATVRIRVKDAGGDFFGTGTIIDSRVGKTVILTCGHIFRNWDKRAVIEPYVSLKNLLMLHHLAIIFKIFRWPMTK